jgi:hypothetical protein
MDMNMLWKDISQDCFYNYDGKYFFNANIRRDGSSVFSPESRWGNFYGLGAAWNVAKGRFLKDNKVINSLKLKLHMGNRGMTTSFWIALQETITLIRTSMGSIISGMENRFYLLKNRETRI